MQPCETSDAQWELGDTCLAVNSSLVGMMGKSVLRDSIKYRRALWPRSISIAGSRYFLPMSLVWWCRESAYGAREKHHSLPAWKSSALGVNAARQYKKAVRARHLISSVIVVDQQNFEERKGPVKDSDLQNSIYNHRVKHIRW